MCPEPARTATPAQPRRAPCSPPRDEVCAKVFDFEAALRDRGLTQQEAAEALGVPRTTLLGWSDRIARTGLTPTQRAFFESPDGVRFLHGLCLAALFVMNVCGGLGVAMVRVFFTYAGLASLLACSETSLLRTRRAMLDAIGAWGDTQDATLAQGMIPRDILVAADENFHEAMMLVAIEPVSGYLLVEQEAAQRDGTTWATVLRDALAKWPVRLVALVGDEAKGLIHCARAGLGVTKASDVFHVLYEIGRGTAGALAQRVRGAENDVETARTALEAADQVRRTTTGGSLHDAYERLGLMLRAAEKVDEARQAVTRVEAHQDAVHAAVRALSDRYHPVDLATGAALSPRMVAERLRAGFATIRTCLCTAGVAAQTRVGEALNKAERVLPSLVGWVQTWQRMTEARVATLGLTSAETQWVEATLLPAIYLHQIAPRGADAARRTQLREVRDRLVNQIVSEGSPWRQWSDATRARVQAAVTGCADLFVRASSCVEGRNGQLSLYHHRTHHLPPALLKALTVVHNYVITRPDGTTAAERFTGQTHANLFEHLVATLPLPARPRIRKPKERPPLFAVA